MRRGIWALVTAAKNVALLGTACVLLAGAPSAFAQGADGGARNVSVRDRAKALFAAQGVRAGTFLAYPSVEVYENYNSNVLASETDEVSDYASQLNFNFGLESNWNTHRLGFQLGTASTFYQDSPKQDNTDVTAALSGRLDVSRSSYFTGDLNAGSLHESIAQSPTSENLAKPIEYDTAGVGVSYVHAFNRIRVSGIGRFDRNEYFDGELADGTPIEQDQRDVEIARAGIRVDYSIGPATSLFLTATKNSYIHDGVQADPTLFRDSDGEEYLAGIRFDLTDLLVGEIGVGQYAQHYDAAGIGSVERAAVRTKLEWYPDELLTVTLDVNREATDSGVVGAAGISRDSAAVRADYEFRRNIIFGAGYQYTTDDYVGIDREDERQTYDITLDYIVDRQWSAYAAVTHYTQDSSGAATSRGRVFDVDQVTFGVRLRR